MVASRDNHHSTPPEQTELSEFQYTILFSLAERPQYGLELKARMTEFYGAEVNHGRLYPNLDHLVERGYVRKSKLDNRTNEYAISERGLMCILERLGWEISALIKDESVADELRRQLEEAVRDGGEEPSTA
ncbi:MAG: helix-turn-helix transcriptional regulator [Halobacteriota archaeon]